MRNPNGQRNQLGGPRTSTPPWLNQALMGGFGFIPRREVDGSSENTSYRSIENILLLAHTQPLRVLTMLPSIVPEFGKAVWNDLRLGCGKDAVRFKAMSVSKNGASIKEEPDGTAEIYRMFDNLQPEVGSVEGALRQNYLMAMCSGMCATEGVPGVRNSGIYQMWPIDTLTTRFRRDKKTGLSQLYQRQTVWGNDPKNERKAYSGYVPLPPERVHWASLDGFPDDPYGRAPLITALMPVLELLAFMRDLLLAWHRVGTPKWDIGFDYEMWYNIAKLKGMTDKEEIAQFVEDERTNVESDFANLNADDAFFHDIKSKVSVNGSGGAWPDVSKIWDLLIYRVIIGLKQMPTLMGRVEGNTETWSSVDWQIYAKGIEAMVSIASRPIVKNVQLHLKLKGSDYIVQTEVEPVRANQRMVDAQSEQIEIDNEVRKILAGFQSQEDASVAITGSGPTEVMDAEKIGQRLAITPLPKPENGDSSTSPKASKTGGKGPSKAN